MVIKLMSPEERSMWKCYYCGESRSVKYKIKEDRSTWAACNRCVARLGLLMKENEQNTKQGGKT